MHFNLHSLPHIKEQLQFHTPETAFSTEATRQAAVAVILRVGKNDALEILFMQRSEHPEDPWSGHMACPGGQRDPEDTSLEAAARRETFEEVGLPLDESMLLGRLHDIGGGRLAHFNMAVTAWVYFHPNPGPLTLNEEVDDTVWVPLDYMADLSNTEQYLFPLAPQGPTYPAFIYESYTIWGITYRVIANLLSLFDIELPRDPVLSDVE